MRTRHSFIPLYFWATVLIVPGLSAGTNSVPLLNSPLVPGSAVPGSPGFTLTVNGTGFVPHCAVNWNGRQRATTFVNGSQVTAAILASDLAVAGTASITVTNPAPGGGTSNVDFFQIAMPANAIAFSAAALTSLNSDNAIYYTAVADVNGDGDLDIVGVDSNGDLVVLLGNGDGTFQVPIVSPLGGLGPLAIGDFNRDGRPDVAALGGSIFSTGPVLILLGNGDGTFQSPKSFPTDAGSFCIALGDFNGDGNLDVAASCGSDNVSILLGNGDGTLQNAVDYGIGQPPFSIVAGDFNRDGHLDLAGAGSSGIGILLGNGDGSFQAPVMIADPAESLAIADSNGDGILDLAAWGISPNATSEIDILLGKGDGTFEPPIVHRIGPYFGGAIPAGDFNGDGKLDLAVSGRVATPSGASSLAIAVLFGNGDGTFQPPMLAYQSANAVVGLTPATSTATAGSIFRFSNPRELPLM